MLLLGAILLAILVLPSPWGIIAVLAGGIIDILESLILLRWSKRRKAVTGAEGLIGQRAIVITPLRPEGQVRVAGELWIARSDAGANPGEVVVVRAADQLTLFVD